MTRGGSESAPPPPLQRHDNGGADPPPPSAPPEAFRAAFVQRLRGLIAMSAGRAGFTAVAAEVHRNARRLAGVRGVPQCRGAIDSGSGKHCAGLIWRRF